jgi:glycosyltransferase involved in cell wall biosynthesis
MYRSKSISVVIPCFNEESQVTDVLATIPEFVDCIIVVNDASTDNTGSRVSDFQVTSKRTVLIELEKNQGVGGAIDTGYGESLDRNFDLTAVMAGDGQMNPDELKLLIDAILNEGVEYAKITRLYDEKYFDSIPRIRLFGNSVLSILTRLSSGYWQMSDSQTGYTVITKSALKRIQGNLWKTYGFPNDVLNKLGLINAKVVEIASKPIYGVGEVSKLRPSKVAWPIFKLLLKGLVRRIKVQYFVRTLHPIGIGYISSFIGLTVGVTWLIEIGIFDFLVHHDTKPLRLISALVLTQSSIIILWITMMFDALLNQNNSRVVHFTS